MQKTKFQIEKLNYDFISKLLEKTLKEREGIIEAKINLDSKKAIVVFDEKKVKPEEVQRLMEEMGFDKITKMSGLDNEKMGSKEEIKENILKNEELKMTEKFSSKVYFWFGFLISFSICSLILNVILFTQFANSKNVDDRNNNIVRNENVRVQNNPSPKIQTFEITKDDHVLGNVDAPITLVNFSCFECPFSGRIVPTLKRILQEYDGKVRVVYKHFPLSSIHPNAQKTAEAAECAAEQGKFWEYHDKVFENQRAGLSVENLKKWAKEVGLNETQFNECLNSGKYAQKVQKDYEEGIQKGVRATPSIFVNGELIEGAVPYETFKEKIDNLLSSK